MDQHKPWFALLVCVGLLLPGLCTAQSSWTSRRPPHAQPGNDHRMDPVKLPAGARVIRAVHYGRGASETFDVYAPAHADHAPVIFMVHGGGWRRGDKAAHGVIQNKVARWVPRGIIVICVDYPLLPQATPLQQALDVAKALAFAQRHAAEWDGDGSQFVLMGHSAGAHLVALISAEPSLVTAPGALPWLGTVALDSATYDVTSIMRGRHFRLYDEAFGNDPAVWVAASPTVQLHARIVPFLAVCSSRREDSCAQARAFVDKARRFGTHAQVLPEDLRQGEIDAELGLASPYTTQVEAFLAALAPSLAARLR